MAKGSEKIASKLVLGFGALIGLWAVSAFIGALYSAHGNFAEVVRGYMVATGMITPIHNMVDYYTHIKGIEYLLCVVFFVVFPAYYISLEKTKGKQKAR